MVRNRIRVPATAASRLLAQTRLFERDPHLTHGSCDQHDGLQALLIHCALQTGAQVIANSLQRNGDNVVSGMAATAEDRGEHDPSAPG